MADGNSLLIAALVVVLAAEFVNGWTDAPNAIATVVSTRVLSPSQAVFMAAVLNVVGAVVTGTAVASTIGTGIVKPDVISGPLGLSVVIAATLTVVIWSTVTWFYGIPTSESHELVAGLTGAGLAVAGPSVLLWEGWQKVLIGLGFSTILGFSLGAVIMSSLYWILRRTSPSFVRSVFSRLEILSAAFLAFSHGSNDGQKFMGAFALALVLGGKMAHFAVPLWVMLLCGAVMGIGTAVGGVAHNPHRWFQNHQAGVSTRFCRYEFRRNCHFAGFPFRHSPEHHPLYKYVYHGGGGYQALFGGTVGSRTKHCSDLDNNLPGLCCPRLDNSLAFEACLLKRQNLFACSGTLVLR
jgi:hypothetical protein